MWLNDMFKTVTDAVTRVGETAWHAADKLVLKTWSGDLLNLLKLQAEAGGFHNEFLETDRNYFELGKVLRMNKEVFKDENLSTGEYLNLLTRFPQIINNAERIAPNEVPLVQNETAFQAMIMQKVLCNLIYELTYSWPLIEQKILSNWTPALCVLRQDEKGWRIVREWNSQTHSYEEYNTNKIDYNYSPMPSMTRGVIDHIEQLLTWTPDLKPLAAPEEVDAPAVALQLTTNNIAAQEPLAKAA